MRRPVASSPASQLLRYSVDSDLHSERDIADYVEGQTHDEIVQHVEKIKQEIVLGDKYEIWDVITDKNRWWVITNLTNLYSQQHFPSLDYTLSFHIGLMMRLRSQSDRIDAGDPSPFDEVFRREEQAELDTIVPLRRKITKQWDASTGKSDFFDCYNSATHRDSH